MKSAGSASFPIICGIIAPLIHMPLILPLWISAAFSEKPRQEAKPSPETIVVPPAQHNTTQHRQKTKKCLVPGARRPSGCGAMHEGEKGRIIRNHVQS